MGLVSTKYLYHYNPIMNISSSLISNILKEKGCLDFRPFSYGEKEVYCYRTKIDSINEFHFCDSNLNELTRDDLGISSDVIFILGVGEEYKILEEGCEIKENLCPPANYCFLVDSNNIIQHFFVKGYVKLNANYYVLEPSLNRIDTIQESGILKPNCDNGKHMVAYNANKDFVFHHDEYQRAHYYSYYWSYKSYHILSNVDGGYLVINDAKEYSLPSFPSLWISDSEVNSIVYLSDEAGKFFLNIIDVNSDETNKIQFSPIKPRCYHYEQGDYVIPPYSEGFQFYAHNNIICVVMQTEGDYDTIDSTILIADKNKWYYYYYGDFGRNRTFVSINNGIITLSEKYNITDCGFSYSTKKVYLDMDFAILGETDNNYHKYIIISRSFRRIADHTTAIVDNEQYTLKGILLCHNMTMIVPIRYEYVEIIDEYAIIGNEYNISGERYLQYGLLRLTDLALNIPIQYCSLKVADNTAAWIVGLFRGKGKNKRMYFGLFYNSELVTEIKYDEIVPLCYKGCLRYKSKKKYGLFYEGKNYLPPRYESISSQDGYLVLNKNNKNGVLSIPKNFMSPIKYDNVKLIADENIFIGDNNLYLFTDGKKLKCIVEGNGRLLYLTSKLGYHLFISKDSTDKYNTSNYECHKLDSLGHNHIVDIKREYGPIRDKYGNLCNLRSGDYFSIDGGNIFYEVNENILSERGWILAPDDYGSDDNWNYERDTYYALGGSDYDRWKDEGGDLDSMMDRMGY